MYSPAHSAPIGQTAAVADPTMPGLSVRDLARRTLAAVQSAATGRHSHRDFVIRRDLAGLDREILRDIGLDRGAL